MTINNNTPKFLNELNEAQREAVVYTDGPELVIAGAGSGKTRVLTYKIAYLLTQGVHPAQIMALTFTNKAAKEMKERIVKLTNEETERYLRMGTFHSIFASILRREANHIGYNSNFTIYDEADSRSLCNSIIKELGLDNKIYRAAAVHARISEAKNNLITSHEYKDNIEAVERDAASGMPMLHKIYTEFNRRCIMSNAMDFDDLLLRTYQLFKNNPDICSNYSKRYNHILIDEYQDTNHAQQQIIQLLTCCHKNICAVGDDAQSIYAFRGANIDHILDFQTQFEGTKLFKLEQNYRSTHCIVNAANSLIAKNQRQIKKDVYSMNDEGERIEITQLSSDREEALFVSKSIKQRILSEGLNYSDFAILYRTNSQSRSFEEQFLKSGIPYRIYGGMSFYQRKEIKDLIAYFRVTVNPEDEEALLRVINYPTRGIGNTTIQKVLSKARSEGMTAWQVLCQLEEMLPELSKGTLNKLTAFRMMIEGFSEQLSTADAAHLGEQIIKQSGISQDLYSSTDPEYLSKQEHLEEFLASMEEFVETQREQDAPEGLVDFLHEVSLLSDRETEDTDKPQVTLMTVHSAKGLEFPCVYIVGMEEDIFPSAMSSGNIRGIEEERRLLYVAITRAERYCHLTYAKIRFRYGKQEWCTPSRFLKEIDTKLLKFNNVQSLGQTQSYNRQGLFKTKNTTYQSQPRNNFTRIEKAIPATSTSKQNTQNPTEILKIGDAVAHNRFGQGVIVKLEGSGPSCKATVDFINAGQKTLMLKFANLHKIST